MGNFCWQRRGGLAGGRGGSHVLRESGLRNGWRHRGESPTAIRSYLGGGGGSGTCSGGERGTTFGKLAPPNPPSACHFSGTGQSVAPWERKGGGVVDKSPAKLWK